MTATPAVHWRSAHRDALAWREWDGEIVIRHAGTGDTHLLSTVGASIFLALVQAGRAVAADELVRQLARFDLAEQDAAQVVETTLSEFERLGLAAPDRP